MALDYNSDKESHVNHEWIVQNATQRPMSGVEVGGQQIQFNREGRARVKDPGIASEIRQQYGKDVVVTRMRHPKPSDQGHRYHFGQWPEMPWKREKNHGNSPAAPVEEREDPPVSREVGGVTGGDSARGGEQ